MLALGGRTTANFDDALSWLRVWLTTPFEGGRHERRVAKIRDYEAREHRGSTQGTA